MNVKGPRSSKASKAKGHATQEMVEEGVCRPEGKAWNDTSDVAVDRGAEFVNDKVVVLGYVYARRHKFYKTFMQRVQGFIIKIKGGKRELKLK